MDLRSYIKLLVRRWPVFVVTTVLVAAILGGASFLIPHVYIATVQLSFSPTLTTDASVEQRRGGMLYVTERLPTYAQAVTTSEVLDPVVRSQRLDLTAWGLADELTVKIPSGTVVLNISVPDDTPEGAAAIANAIAGQMPAEVARLEGSATVDASPVSVEVLQEALPPEYRVSPNLRLNFAVAGLIALFLGILAAVLADSFDTRIRRGKDVTVLGLSYLGGLERVRRASGRELLRFEKNTPERVALFRRMAIDMLFLAEEKPTHIVFTAPASGAGKTTAAANIASALAEAGNRVAYIDADVRGGRLAAQIGVPQTRGITDLVAGKVDLDEALFFWKTGDFTIIPCGGTALDISEMLAGEKFRTVLDEMDELFEVIIVDAPPIANASDAARFTQNISNTVIVVESIETRRQDLLRVSASLRQAGAKLLGVMLSRVDRSEESAPADEEESDAGSSGVFVAK